MPKISVIMPVYNVEKYLRECLDSVLVQTMRDFEVICVDDGSTDGSLGILDEYATRDARMRVVRCEHTNAGHCRNVGLEIAKGEYLLFLDSDDVFAPRMFEYLLGAIEASSADIATCRESFFVDGEDVPRFTEEAKFLSISNPAQTKDIFTCWVGWAWDKLLRRKFVEGNGLRFQEISAFNDLYFTYSALALSHLIVSTNAELIAHRARATSISGEWGRKNPDAFVSALREYRKEMERTDVFASANFTRTFNRYAVRFSLMFMDKMPTYAGYEKLYAQVQGLYKTFGLVACAPDQFDSNTHYQRVKSMLAGIDPWEELRDRTFAQGNAVETLARIYRSHSYRLGRFILKVPQGVLRIAKAIVRKG